MTLTGILRSAHEAALPFAPVLDIAALLFLLAPSAVPQFGSSQTALTMLRGDTFGPGWTADSLANLEIGMNPGRAVSYRFRADHEGAASGVRVYFIFRTLCGKGCYAAGNGGAIRIEMRDDDGTANHLPAAPALATALVPDPLSQWNRLVRFQRPANLKAGRLYHIVFTNVSEDPTANFVSIDDLYTAADDADLHPAARETDLAVLLRANFTAGWEIKRHQLPIFALDYADGFLQGQAYIDVKQSGVVVSPGSSVREVFTMRRESQPITLAGVRVKPLTRTGKLRITLTTETGLALETATVLPEVSVGQSTWNSIQFRSPRGFAKGATYALVLTSEDGGQYLIQPLQDGRQYGFAIDSPISQQHCEITTGQVWRGCLNRSDLDIPFFFRATGQ